MAISRDRLLIMCGWLVHFYTASGAVIGLITIEMSAAGNFRGALLMMLLALVIDSTDGFLARAVRVSRRIPIFDGATLDNIVDYLNYVAAPAFLMRRAELWPRGSAGELIGAAVLVASAYGFSRLDAKTADHYFRGFPSYWNLVALYLFCLGWPTVVNGAITLALAMIVFAPIKFIYPSRTAPLRALTLTLAAGWGIVTAALITDLPRPAPLLLCLSLAFVVYYFVMSVALQLSARPLGTRIAADRP